MARSCCAGSCKSPRGLQPMSALRAPGSPCRSARSPAASCSASRMCRESSLHRPLVELSAAPHGVGMAATGSFDPSRELGPTAVAHLSRYRCTSCKHTNGDDQRRGQILHPTPTSSSSCTSSRASHPTARGSATSGSPPRRRSSGCSAPPARRAAPALTLRQRRSEPPNPNCRPGCQLLTQVRAAPA